MLPAAITVRRSSDPIYMAHGYLTKVPVSAIIPFIEAFTRPGDLVVDPFAGSGMTGVAAAITNRRAILSDISRLGQHIGLNYVNLIEPTLLRNTAASVVRQARARAPGLYTVPCQHCGQPSELIKATWSQDYACAACHASFTYYHAMEAANWEPRLSCPSCSADLDRRRLQRVGETLVLESVYCDSLRRQVEQLPSGVEPPRFAHLECWPDVPIDSDREMFRRSALAKHGLLTTASFFSRRNLTALVALHQEILRIPNTAVRNKLLFVFTAILARASKRYQWSRQRPLNAQNQTYYIAPVYYEWNVFDLFERKVEAVIASDDAIRGYGPLFTPRIDVEYYIASADDLSHLESNSVDYIFTDPPFGSNIFYSDMNLFQEAWLGSITDRSKEAVISTSVNNGSTPSRYEQLLSAALQECHRILKPGGWLSMIFSNSKGEIWGIAQRALKCSGLELVPDLLLPLDKGQRSVKGLASGWEAVVTTDLVLTARKLTTNSDHHPVMPPAETAKQAVAAILAEDGVNARTASEVYLSVIRRHIARHWDIESLHFTDIIAALRQLGYTIDPSTGICRPR